MMVLRTVNVWILLAALPIFSSAKTITIHPGISLQTTLDQAEPGDTIMIGKGFYNEHDIQVSKPVSLIGEDYPVFDGKEKNEVFIITADQVTVQGLQIQHTGRSSLVDMAGIKLKNVTHVTVRRCRLLNTTYGVYLQNSRRCTIEQNEVKGVAKDELQSGNGIHAWKSDHLLIRNNRISGHRDGIYFEFVTESLIEGNLSAGNIRYGLHFMFSHNDTYSNNTFQHNGAGVAVMYTKGVTMRGNRFHHNWGDAAYALLLKDISDSRIEQNRFEKNTVGIFMEGSSRIHVAHNRFSDNGWGMRIQASCDNNVFERNNFLGNSFDVATNGTMMLNTFRNNYWDKYEGYDLDRDGVGDIPYYPVSVYSVITERIPAAMILYRSFLTNIMEQVEKVIPSIIPDQLKDEAPQIKAWPL
jgi:nitrous oxidase accessory protein